jgi:acid phosphatase type 7
MGRRWAVAVAAAVVMSTLAGVGVASGDTAAVPLATGDPVVAAAGDIACAPPARRTASGCHHRDTSDLLVAGGYDGVLPLGDVQYECGQASAYRSVYDPTWGRVKAVTHPAVGDNEYSGTGCSTSGASGYFGYFGSAATPRQPSCRSACAGYYSYDLGTWHIVVLNTECSRPGVGGCTSSSPQGRWLAADLAAHPNQCTLAYWHKPRFSSGTTHGGSSSFDPFWQALYAAKADVVLVGHEHNYERFAKQNPSGAADPNGIQQFVVGTGGASHGYSFGTPVANSQVRNDSTFGVLKLTLHPTSYDWQFVPIAGSSFTDSGSGSCP